jgi:hypothetical protein
MKDITIFNNLIKQEPHFTQLFYNFLKVNLFRQSFLDLIKFDFDKKIIDFEHFQVEYHLSKYGKPDIVLQSYETEILFEIKSWYNRGLTKNQPDGYYKYLKQNSARHKALILICPEDYEHLDIFNQRIDKIKSENDNIYLQTIYWEEIASQIKSKELDLQSPLIKEYLIFFNNWFQLEPIFLNNVNLTIMFGPEFPESLQKMMQFVENQYDYFQEKIEFPIKWSNEKKWEEYGFKITLPYESGYLFIGIWFDYWKKTGNPFCISLYTVDKKLIKLFNKSIAFVKLEPAIKFGEWVVTFIDKNIFIDEKNCQKLITNKLMEIINGINQDSLE